MAVPSAAAGEKRRGYKMAAKKSEVDKPERSPMVILFAETRGFTGMSDMLEPGVVLARVGGPLPSCAARRRRRGSARSARNGSRSRRAAREAARAERLDAGSAGGGHRPDRGGRRIVGDACRAVQRGAGAARLRARLGLRSRIAQGGAAFH